MRVWYAVDMQERERAYPVDMRHERQLSICGMPHIDRANGRVNGMVWMCGMPREWYAIDFAYACLHSLFAASFLSSFTLSPFICIRICTYECIYVYTYICMHTHVCMHVCIYIYV